MGTFEKLVEERKRLKIKQKDLAIHLGISKNTMGRYERFERMIPGEMVDQYADYLGYEIKLMLK